jgi:adenylylsulfate kinase
MGQGFAVWFTGLPGSGKSTLARAARDFLASRGLDAVLLEMDVRRKAYFPRPRYDAAERERAYELFAQEAADLVGRGRVVVLDGTAYRRLMRDRARALIPRFAEVFVRCPVEVAMQREAGRPQGRVMADLYAKALERKRSGKHFEGLGEVVGVDVPFEADERAECVIDSAALDKDEAAARVREFLAAWLDRNDANHDGEGACRPSTS